MAIQVTQGASTVDRGAPGRVTDRAPHPERNRPERNRPERNRSDLPAEQARRQDDWRWVVDPSDVDLPAPAPTWPSRGQEIARILACAGLQHWG